MKKLYALLAVAVMAAGVSYAAPAKVSKLNHDNLKLMNIGTEAPALIKDFSGMTAKKAPSRAEGEAPVLAQNFTGYYGYDGSTYADGEVVFTPQGDNKYTLNHLIYDEAANMDCSVAYDAEYEMWFMSVDCAEPAFYDDLSDYAAYGFTNNEPIYLGLGSGNSFYQMETMDWVVDPDALGEVLGWAYNEGYTLIFHSRYIEKVGALVFGGFEPVDFYAQNATMTTLEEPEDENATEMVEAEYKLFAHFTELVEGAYFVILKGLCGWPGTIYFQLSSDFATATAPDQVVYSDATYGDFYITNDTEEMVLPATLSVGEDGNSVINIDGEWAVYVPDVETAAALYADSKIYLPFNVAETTGVSKVENDNVEGPAVYYNLQGQQVQNPAAGLYIVRQGSKATKVLVK